MDDLLFARSLEKVSTLKDIVILLLLNTFMKRPYSFSRKEARYQVICLTKHFMKVGY